MVNNVYYIGGQIMIFVWQVNVSQIQFENGKMIQASKFGKEDTSQTKLELTPEEETMIQNLKVWSQAFKWCSHGYLWIKDAVYSLIKWRLKVKASVPLDSYRC